MNEAKAREILGEWFLQKDDSLYNNVRFMDWHPGEERACLDADFTADELEAIAWWMRHKGQRND
ncbi:MAG: hypothetical protein IPO08_25060 [Xanthomonadales bacterium]|nr:hypothetical protein [Xanthomonadales bacterium]